ncbi:MAG: ferrous iron transport protein B [Clostridia bacterium]|nr:ferrous iron transport protein B [Clostridia bacterium]
MGLSGASTGKNAAQKTLFLSEGKKVVALAGNPNVGKSTVFNALTGLRQHTGNWPGKTVTSAVGEFSQNGETFSLVDLPGTYSLFPHSKEESVARDFLCFEKIDAAVVVCDCTTLERSLSLVLQVLEVTGRVVVCLNLADEAEKKNIKINEKKLEKILGVPVVLTDAKNKKGLEKLKEKIFEESGKDEDYRPPFSYDTAVETAIKSIEGIGGKRARFLKAQLLFGDESFKEAFEKKNGEIKENAPLSKSVDEAKELLSKHYPTGVLLKDSMTLSLLSKANEISKLCVDEGKRNDSLDRKLDRVFTGAKTGIPVMLLLLALVLFITIYAANYPSELLSRFLFSLGEKLRGVLEKIGAAWWITEPLVDGVYKTMAWVVSVMLPPMAIFFPLFTLLEDFGYLPRVAFNLDHCFKKCNACGKQSLCMCMGLGCNAAGVVGCRIIDSKRERLIAILTNAFMPCNGRFPTIIAIISMFFSASLSAAVKPFFAALILTAVILLSVLATFSASRLLSKTVLKGESSAFTLEMPPYRVPKIGSVLVRSVFDRTLFVLSRAVCVSAPMGLFIWLLANIKIGNSAVVSYVSSFLDFPGRLVGLDGVILLSFILGFPANEIVLPVALMCYTSQGVLCDAADLSSVYSVLSQNGWTAVTGVCFILFSLMHFPCSTTLLTIFKETKSFRWTVLSFLLPTVYGVVLCFLVNLVFGSV